ncbi:hypothetical protein [Streptomyces sp. NPDC052693]|uniref:hypothetical protein n=1 Tax=Streptomyces sp. NPDC052693 TaxID=3155814 RepID=UPI003423F91D
MRPSPFPARSVARLLRRPRPLLATAAVTVLAVTACGTERAGADRPDSGSARSAGADVDAAFTEMLSRVARQCPSSASPEAPPTGPVQAAPTGPARAPRTGPAETLPTGSAAPLPSGPVETPPSGPVEPIAPTRGPEVELNARDWCAGNLHEQRVAQALWYLPEPTPAKVRTVLNDLGYVDARIHDLRQSGPATRFLLDLRDRGGRLCLDGSAAAKRTEVEMCVAPASGPFKPAE